MILKYASFFLVSFLTFFGITQSIDLDINLDSAKQTFTKLNGFNTGTTYNEVFESSANVVSTNNHCQGNNNAFSIVSFNPKPEFITKTALLKPNVLRYPGGTIANYNHIYQYDGDSTYDHTNPKLAVGFGVQDQESSVYVYSDVIRSQYCKWDNEVQLIDQNENPNFINGFANIVDQLETEVHSNGDPGYKLDVIYVVNLLSHFETKNFIGGGWTTIKESNLIPSDTNNILNISDPTTKFELYFKENMDAINYLINRGVNITAVEMGNELYFQSYANRNNMDAYKYMPLAEIYATRIKAIYPNMKIGVITEKQNSTWHNHVASYTPSFYDAYAIHEYYSDNQCIQNISNVCSPGCASGNVIWDKECRFECGKCALDDFVKVDLLDKLDQNSIAFAPNKKIWFTEWNLVNNSGLNKGNNLDYMNTFLHASFVFEHMLKQFEYNAENFGNNPIEYSTHHRIGYKINWSVIQTRLEWSGAKTRASFFSFDLLKNLFESQEVLRFETPSLQGLTHSNDANLSSFFLPPTIVGDDGKIILTFTNKSDYDLSINYIDSLLSHNGENFTIANTAKISYLVADTSEGLYASESDVIFSTSCDNIFTGCNQNITDNTGNSTLDTIKNQSINLLTDKIPAFSMGVIEIDAINLSNIGIENSFFKNNIKVYPSPATDEITIESQINDLLSNTTCVIYSALGKKVKELRLFGNRSKVDIEQLANGIYFISINENGKNVLVKLIVKQ